MGNQPGYENTELQTESDAPHSFMVTTTHADDHAQHNLNDSDFNDFGGSASPDNPVKEVKENSFSPKLNLKKKKDKEKEKEKEIEFEKETVNPTQNSGGDQDTPADIPDEVTNMDKKFRKSKIKTPKMRRSKTSTHQPSSKSSKNDPALYTSNSKPLSSNDPEELDVSDNDDSIEGDEVQLPKNQKPKKFSFRYKKKTDEISPTEEVNPSTDNVDIIQPSPRKKIFSRIKSHREHTELKKEPSDSLNVDDDVKKYGKNNLTGFSQKSPKNGELNVVERKEPMEYDPIKTFKKSKSLLQSPKVKKANSAKKSGGSNKVEAIVADDFDQLPNDDYME
jgi:hypothetical protein